MPSQPSRRLILSSAAAGAALTLASCGKQRDTDDGDAEETTLLLRVWEERAADAYREALKGFSTSGGFTVEVEVEAWADYWENLPLEVAAGDGPDIAWMNTAQLARFRTGEQLLEVGAVVGDAASQWEEHATAQYRDDAGLWGVPQTWAATMLAVNRAHTDEAGVDPSSLVMSPSGDGDTLSAAAAKLTIDGQGRHPGEDGFDAATRTRTGFSAHPDRTAVLGPVVASAGGSWQADDGAFTFADGPGAAAIAHLVDMAARGLAPDGAETSAQPALCRTMFIQGRLSLLQTGTYDLRTLIDDSAGAFPIELHPVVAGPKGRWPLVHTVAAVGVQPDDDEERATAIGEVLARLGEAKVHQALIEAEVGIPARKDQRGAWVEYWVKAGADPSAVLEGVDAADGLAEPEKGVRSAEGTAAAMPVLGEAFATPAEAAQDIARAQEEANAARAG